MRFLNDPRCDDDFLRRHMMGPNCLRIAEELIRGLDFGASRRILDLGCGMGLTAMFLAQNTPARIFAFDLWIDASENHARFASFGLDDRIFPLHGEAAHLPFARGYFDAVVCIDAYPYFGADKDFLDNCLAPYVKHGGLIAVGLPGLQRDFDGDVPEELKPYWQPDINFYSMSWWESLFRKSRKVRLEQCFSMQCHKQAWDDWLVCDNEYAKRDVGMMAAEGGKYFDTIALVARVC